METLFISYRRDDSQGFAGRLADDLATQLGANRVFSDVEIPAGTDFAEVLQRAVAASDALLVVIGLRWAADSARGYHSRLFEPADWVRTEIEAAFAQGKIVVPVLVGGAKMPAAQTLPKSLQPLTRLQAAVLDDRHWDTNLALLLRRLRKLLPALAGPAATGPLPATPLEQVIREIADRVLGEAARQGPPSAPQSRPARRKGFVWRQLTALSLWLGRILRRLLTLVLVLVLAVLYTAVRLLGDSTTLRQLDAVAARLQVGWQWLLRGLR